MVFWREYDTPPEWPAMPLVEIPERAIRDECVGRAEGLTAYTAAMVETLDQPRHGAEFAILAEWEEYIRAVEHGLDELPQDDAITTARGDVKEARTALSAHQGRFTASGKTRDEREDWETPARMASVRALAATVRAHLNALGMPSAAQRRRNALAADTAGYNLMAQAACLPEEAPRAMRGTTELNQADLNETRRRAATAEERLAATAQKRLQAVETVVSEKVSGSTAIAATAETALTEMLRNNHRFGITDAGDRTGRPLIVFRLDGKVHAKLTDDPYPPDTPSETAREHGKAMLAMAAGGSAGDEPEGEIDDQVRRAIAEGACLTLARADAGMHDLDEAEVERLLGTLHECCDGAVEMTELVNRLAGGSDALRGWLCRHAPTPDPQLTPEQGRAMRRAANQAGAPAWAIRNALRRAGLAPESVGLPKPEGETTKANEAARRTARVSKRPELAEAVRRAMNAQELDEDQARKRLN